MERHGGGHRPRAALAAGHAEPRRRLGGLRSQQRPRVPLPRPLRRSQRHDRPEHARPGRPRVGGPGPIGPPRGRSGGGPGRGLRSPHAERRRKLVRPLGRQLHLRHLAGAGRTGGRRRAGRRPGHRGRGQLAAGPPAGRAAAGANRPTATSVRDLRGQGPPTASQTAWALLGLLAAGLDDHPAVARGVRYLLPMQNDDGTWDEPEFTGTGFPARVLPAIPLLPDLFPAAGPVAVGGEQSNRWRQPSTTQPCGGSELSPYGD